MANRSSTFLDRVQREVAKYEHPLLTFFARESDGKVEVVIEFKKPAVPVHTYHFSLHPRDLDSPQFEWHFQRLLYDCLHDYLIEMFICTPQDRQERDTI